MTSIDSVSAIGSILNRSIADVAGSISCYCKDPVSDFTGNRLLPAGKLMRFIIQMQAKSTGSELSGCFTDSTIPSASAFCQQRAKLDPGAMARAFQSFSYALPQKESFYGYRVLACDGSDINIPYNPLDKETFVEQEGMKGYN